MDVNRAVEFVRENGNDFDRAKLSRILGEEFNAQAVVDGFSGMQNPDGGFPYGDRKGFPSCLSNTTMALHELRSMGLGDSEPAGRGIGYLLGAMRKDGAWEENPKIKPLDPPFWDMPGDENTTIWLTATVADILLRSGREVSDTTFDYLREKQGPDGRFAGYYHTTWIALSLFGEKGLCDGKTFASALAYLEGADISDWDVSCISWCLDCMNHGGVGVKAPLREKLMHMLSETQEPDGSWPSDGGEHARARDVNSVLAAIMYIL